jgi:formylglycine-generating enzyme required for sulfatase activity
MNVWEWHWAGALVFAAPGLLFMALMIPGALASVLKKLRKSDSSASWKVLVLAIAFLIAPYSYFLFSLGKQFDGDAGSGDKPVISAPPLPLSETLAREVETKTAISNRPITGHNFSLPLGGGVSLEMIWIPAGEFIIGSYQPGSRLPTRVRLSSGYWIGKTPVTQAQWQALMGANPSYFKHSGLNAPVENVSWYDVVRFTQKLTQWQQQEGHLPKGYLYSLPSDTEWEYAVRAGSATRWSFGEEEWRLQDYAWFDRNSRNQTHPVAQKLPNPWGLYDVHGNVWEWTRSWYGSYPGGNVTDYHGPTTGSNRVYRGGSWRHTSLGAQTTYRMNWLPETRRNFIGFRLALVPTS